MMGKLSSDAKGYVDAALAGRDAPGPEALARIRRSVLQAAGEVGPGPGSPPDQAAAPETGGLATKAAAGWGSKGALGVITLSVVGAALVALLAHETPSHAPPALAAPAPEAAGTEQGGAPSQRGDAGPAAPAAPADEGARARAGAAPLARAPSPSDERAEKAAPVDALSAPKAAPVGAPRAPKAAPGPISRASVRAVANASAQGVSAPPPLLGFTPTPVPPPRETFDAGAAGGVRSPSAPEAAPRRIAVAIDAGDGAPPVTPGPKPGAGVPSLAAELIVLREAQQAMREGKPARAIEVLDRNAMLFSGSPLASERRATRLFALCKASPGEEARQAAARFVADAPRSPLAASVQRACLSGGGVEKKLPAPAR